MDELATIFEALIPISFFALVLLIVYFTARFRYKLKKSIIEKGDTVEFPKSRFPLLEVGITILGFGVGMLAGSFVMMLQDSFEMAPMTAAALIFLFSAAGMIVAFFVRRRLDDRTER